MNEFIEQFAEMIAAKVEARLRAGASPGAVDQSKSPLGRRKHIQAVRARIARGESGASIVGRKHYLDPAALADEMGRCSTHTATGAKPVCLASSVRAELERELRIVSGGKGG